MIEPSSTEPSAIRAGDAVVWTRDLPEYLPADGWTLAYRLLYASGTAVDIAADADGTRHRVELDSATTAALTAGRATLVWWVTDGADQRTTLGQAAIEILPDLAVAATFDGRSTNEIALADARAALAAYVAGGQAHIEEYVIAQRRMKFRDVQQIRDLIAHYEREVAKDNARAAALQGVVPGRIYTRF